MIIITGASGQLGRALFGELSLRGIPACGVDITNIPETCKTPWINVDLAEPPSGFTWPPETNTVVHLAGSVIPDTFSPDSISKWMRANFLTTCGSLRACHTNVTRFIYASSISVYGHPAINPITEEMAAVPLTGYGVSKLMGEMVCQSFFRDGNNQALTIIRLAQVYGPGTLPQNALYRLIHQAIGTRKLSLQCPGNLQRDYIYITDVVNALLSAIQFHPAGIYNVGLGRPVTMGEIAEAIAQAIPGCSKPEYSHPKEGDYSVSLSTKRFSEATGFRTRIQPKAGVAKEVFRLINSLPGGKK